MKSVRVDIGEAIFYGYGDLFAMCTENPEHIKAIAWFALIATIRATFYFVNVLPADHAFANISDEQWTERKILLIGRRASFLILGSVLTAIDRRANQRPGIS